MFIGIFFLGMILRTGCCSTNTSLMQKLLQFPSDIQPLPTEDQVPSFRVTSSRIVALGRFSWISWISQAQQLFAVGNKEKASSLNSNLSQAFQQGFWEHAAIYRPQKQFRSCFFSFKILQTYLGFFVTYILDLRCKKRAVIRISGSFFKHCLNSLDNISCCFDLTLICGYIFFLPQISVYKYIYKKCIFKNIYVHIKICLITGISCSAPAPPSLPTAPVV